MQIWWKDIVLLTVWENEKKVDYRTEYDENYKGMTRGEEFFMAETSGKNVTKGQFGVPIMSADWRTAFKKYNIIQH